MPDDVPTRCVDPHARLLDARRIGDEDELIAFAQAEHHASAVAEHRTVHGCFEARCIGEDGRHWLLRAAWGVLRSSQSIVWRDVTAVTPLAVGVPARPGGCARDPEPPPLVTDMSPQSPAAAALALSLRGFLQCDSSVS